MNFSTFSRAYSLKLYTEYKLLQHLIKEMATRASSLFLYKHNNSQVIVLSTFGEIMAPQRLD
jgi:hypothetical protein